MQGNDVARFNVNIPVFVEELGIFLEMCERDFCSPCRKKFVMEKILHANFPKRRTSRVYKHCTEQ
jgi:hypothetical protein